MQYGNCGMATADDVILCYFHLWMCIVCFYNNIPGLVPQVGLWKWTQLLDKRVKSHAKDRLCTHYMFSLFDIHSSITMRQEKFMFKGVECSKY
ncbi:hypothetical protein RND71_011819 [Anisodus tanguticus]|uniref:Uncharacterized protein n=1 Tax=Anisodus tanguticus TaxID=243964 RepID=A0AAE1SEK1_9SOLA|nr:hypothetical protein RND71_011819 [Anisodus tanguticus]